MEFKVRTKKLKGSANTIRNSWAGLRGARWEIESVIRNLNVGNSTGEIRNSLKGSKDRLSFLEGTTSRVRSNLEAIATQYEVTEASIRNQKKKKVSLSSAATSIAAIPGLHSGIKKIWGKGKKLWNKHVGDPVAVDSGNFILEVTDLEFNEDDPLNFVRFYNSSESDTGALGNGWIHSFEMHLRVTDEGAAVVLGDGSEEVFRLEDGRYLPIGGTSELEKAEDVYRLKNYDEDTFVFDEQGALTRFEDANGFGITFEYNGGSLTKAVKDSGEYLEFTYSSEEPSYVETVSDHTGRSVSYKYAGKKLTDVINGERVTKYEYDRSGNLSDVIDPRGITVVHNEYDSENRVVRQLFPDDTEMKYSYDEDNAATVVTEKDGSESYHFHDELMRNTENIYRDGNESYEYNEQNLVTSETDRNGNETKYQYDNRGNISRITYPDGAVVNLTYEKHNKPVSISLNGVRRQKNVYDSKGNLLESTDALRRRTSYKYNDRGLPVEITLPGGGVYALSYDDRGNISRIEDDQGAEAFYEYDELNRLVLSSDGLNNRTVMEYDRFGNLICVTDPFGNTRTYSYNDINRISEMKDFNGAVTHIGYNSLGLPCIMKDPLGRVTELEYDSMWNVAVEKLPDGGVRRIEYDEYGRAVKETDPLGHETLFDYDGNGNLLSRTDPEGAITAFSYDSEDRLTAVVDPEHNETRYEYDINGNLSYIRNANGAEVRMEYDDADQLIRETDPFGQTREYTYNADGDISSVIDEAGRKATFEYASPGKPSRVVLPDGQEETLTYDERGNVLTRANNRGLVLTYTYDALNRMTEVKGSNGEHSVFTYDAVGNLTSASDEKGNTISYEYTLTGQISCVIDELGNRTEYDYDALDRLKNVKRYDEYGSVHKTEYVRDLAGNVIESIDPLGYIEKYMYNGRGELTQKVDKDGYITKFGYDGNGELNSVLYDDGREVLMRHDALGKLAEVMDWTGTTRIESDLLGRVTKVIYPDERYAEYTYGKTGERTSLRHPDGRLVKYGYDKDIKLISLTEGDTSVRYSYDELGQLTGKAFSGGLAVSYAYDTKGQLTELINKHKDKTLDSIHVTYDPYGNKTSVSRMRDGLPEESGLFEYGYDPAGRLTSVSKDGTVLRQFEYDAFGNRTALISGGIRTEYTYDSMDRLLSSSGPHAESFRYDKRGNLIERTSDNGSISYTYSYDSTGRLESAANGTLSAKYYYNGLGHRIEESVRNGLEPERRITYTADMTKSFNNLLEINNNGESEAYIWDGIVAAVKGKRNYEFACDEMGSPLRLLGMDGSSAEVYGYDEFGTSLYEEGDIQPVRYMGYRKDPAAGMYFVQAREYMPEHGRFAGQDALKGNTVNPATQNQYIYCGDMPLVYYDPDGLLWHVVIGAAVGGIVGGGVELGKQLIQQAASGKGVSLKNVNWGKVGTSALGGAVEGGIIAACPAGAAWAPYVAAGVSGFVEGTAEARIVEGKGWGESLANGAIDGAVGVAFTGIGDLFKKSKLGKKLANFELNNNKITKWFDKCGSNYKTQVGRANTRFWNNVLHHAKKARIQLGWKTVRNGLAHGVYDKVTGYLKPKKWLKKWAGGAIKCLVGVA